VALADHIKERIDRSADEIDQIEINIAALGDDCEINKRVSNIIHITCAICAGIAAQPIPFADFFILTPIQGAMAYKIAQVYGINIKKNRCIPHLQPPVASTLRSLETPGPN
jgi:hypothetical protein